MKKVFFAVALFVAVAVVLGVTSQQADAQKKKSAAVTGKLTKVDIKNGTGTIDVAVVGKKKKGEPAPEPKTVTFKVSKDTKIQKASGVKGEPPADASADDLKVGLVVSVTRGEDDPNNAVRILILAMKKKKAN